MDSIAAATSPDTASEPDLSAAPPSPDTDTGFSLTSEQLDAAGLTDLQVGDSFTVTITGTVTDTTDGIKADIESASDGNKTDVTDPDDGAMNPDDSAPPVKKPQSRVVGPKEAGFED